MATVLEPPISAIEADEPVWQASGRIVLRLPSDLIDPEEFFAICQLNDALRLEREANGDVIIMPPVAGSSGRRNIKVSYHLEHWHVQTGLGVAFDSSTGFTLPDGSVLSPDASWITTEQWEALTQEQQDRFLPLCPVFAVELLSPTDRLSDTRKKMRSYLANGTRLAWLIIPKKKQVEIYESGKASVVLERPQVVSGEPVLPGFVLELTEIWE